MKTFALQKRLAASVLGVGQNKVWFDSERLDEIRDAITKVDIADLIKDKAIKKKPVKGVKRRAGKIRQKKKRKGRRRKEGKKKKKLRKRKAKYVRKIRKLRIGIQELRKEKKLSSIEYQKLRKLAKAGMFRSKADIKEKIKEMRK